MANPLVSIIIPAYNRANLIGETLDSVLAQTYQNWECIVVDDGSTDNTKEVVQKYVDKDARFILVNRPNTHKPGGNGARNYGFEISKGEYIQWFDSDDLMDKNKLTEQIKLIENEPESTICFSKYYLFSGKLSSINIKKNQLACFKNYTNPNDYIKYYCIKGYGFYTACLLVHRDMVLKVKGWNESLIINQDGEFITKVVLNSKKIAFANSAIAFYRIDSSSKMRSKFSKKAEYSFESCKAISNHIMKKADFIDKSQYCATLFVQLKFQYPFNNDEIWKKADTEIKKLGGKFIYIYPEKVFVIVWKTFGLKTALFYRRIKNYFNKQRRIAQSSYKLT